MLIDPAGRPISYLRLSVTDRCDLRCVYCLGGAVQFVPRDRILSLEEIERAAAALIGLGIRRLRLTGGEPLLRRGLVGLAGRLAAHRGGGLDELTLTTNGTRLAEHAAALAAAGVGRINVSLDALSPDSYRRVTGGGRVAPVLEGIAAARAAGLAVRVNALALRGLIETEIDSLLAWCGGHGCDLAVIEPMPFGGPGLAPVPLAELRRSLEQRWTLRPDPFRSAGPARYVTVAETGGRLGFIAPISHGFCAGCNRLRLTATGALFPCLAAESSIDLRPALREGGDLTATIRAAIAAKPAAAPGWPGSRRALNLTGG